jgi:hypothetical protein
MTMERRIAAAKERYQRLFGAEPAEVGACDDIEKRLGVPLPLDLRQIAEVYAGGLIGGIEHNSLADHGPATNVVDETERLRRNATLPHQLVVLAEPPDSLIVLRTVSSEECEVIWCSAFDVARLANPSSLTKPDIWSSYIGFFEHLLDLEEEERQES